MFTNADINFKPLVPNSLGEKTMYARVRSLSGGLEPSEGGLQAGKKLLGDNFDPKRSYDRAFGETAYRLETLRAHRSGEANTNPDEIKAMEKTKERLHKTLKSLKNSKPDTWYGKLGKSIMTAFRGVRDSILNTLSRHVTSNPNHRRNIEDTIDALLS